MKTITLFSSPQSLDRNIVVRSHARVSSLTLKNVQFTYAGQYLCTASNSIGQDDQNMYLEVRCKSPRSSYTCFSGLTLLS